MASKEPHILRETDDATATLHVNTDENNEVPQSFKMSAEKPRSIHMDMLACYDHAGTVEGKKSLTSPVLLKTPMVDVNKGLYPVVRKRKRKTFADSGNSEELTISSHNVSLSQGFVSASNMYNIVKQNSSNGTSNILNRPDFPKLMNQSAAKRSKTPKQIHNQGSMLNFVSVKPSPIKDAKAATSALVDDDSVDSLNKPHTTKMYSPIKKLGNDSDSNSCIYISDSSPAGSPSSSLGSQTLSQTNKIADNPAVKKLFEAQKTLDLKSKDNGKRKKLKPMPSPFVNSKEIESIKHEATKFFEGDSFDIDAAFGSDMDSSDIKYGGTTDKTKEKSSDKYGLLGSGSYSKEDSEKINYFEMLPHEVLENIFCQLPLLDLCLNSNRVCMQWNNIIADEKVISTVIHAHFSNCTILDVRAMTFYYLFTKKCYTNVFL